jgi:hypothetical protein
VGGASVPLARASSPALTFEGLSDFSPEPQPERRRHVPRAMAAVMERGFGVMGRPKHNLAAGFGDAR